MSQIEVDSRIGFRKEVSTQHYPITVAEALDYLLTRDGYKRIQAENDSDEFVWENDSGDRFEIDYYTQVKGISRLRRVGLENMSAPDLTTELGELFASLRTTITSLEERMGPYFNTTRQLILRIQGHDSRARAAALTPIVRELYLKEEKLGIASADILEETPDSVQVLFSPAVEE